MNVKLLSCSVSVKSIDNISRSILFNILFFSACRNQAAGEKLVKEIRDSGVTTGSTKVLTLDNSSFDSTRNFVTEVKKDYDKVDVLINNGNHIFLPFINNKVVVCTY